VIATESVARRLRVAVHNNEFATIIGPVPCWTYVSDGLSRLGQREVALSIRRGADEAAPDFLKTPFEFYRFLHDNAEHRRFVDVGDITGLDPDAPGLLGHASIRGVVYTPADALNDQPFPSPTIAAVPATGDELDVAKRFGIVRLAALLGDKYRRFPTAAWYERNRASVVVADDMQDSILTKVAGFRAPGVHVYMRGIEVGREVLAPTGPLENAVATFARQEVVCELPTSLAQHVAQALGRSGGRSAIALLAGPDAEADACLCWRAGAMQPYAITAASGIGARVAGNHLLVVPWQETDTVRVVEDGFAVLITDTTFDEIAAD
jgi:hypothetical protein